MSTHENTGRSWNKVLNSKDYIGEGCPSMRLPSLMIRTKSSWSGSVATSNTRALQRSPRRWQVVNNWEMCDASELGAPGFIEARSKMSVGVCIRVQSHVSSVIESATRKIQRILIKLTVPASDLFTWMWYSITPTAPVCPTHSSTLECCFNVSPTIRLWAPWNHGSSLTHLCLSSA